MIANSIEEDAKRYRALIRLAIQSGVTLTLKRGVHVREYGVQEHGPNGGRWYIGESYDDAVDRMRTEHPSMDERFAPSES